MTTTAMTGNVLVLNASYEPLHHVSLKHAIKMLVREVAVIEEAHDEHMVGAYRLPRVLRLVRYVVMSWRYRRAPVCTRSAILMRDRECAYCRGPAETIDHILPKSRGGASSFMNLVAACRRCNHRKANRTPEEARMPLLFEPYVPTWAGAVEGRR